MKELTSNTGGRYLFFDDIQDLQNSALASAAALYFGKDNCVISGCRVSGNSISAGFVWLDGKIREVPATSNLNFPVYIKANNTTEQGMYQDSVTEQDTAINYGIQFTTVQPESYIRVTSSGAEPTIEKLMFNGLNLDGNMAVGELTANKLIFRSRTTPSNLGELYYDNDGFHASTGITTGTGTFSGAVTAGSLSTNEITVRNSSSQNNRIIITHESIVYHSPADEDPVTLRFNAYYAELSKPLQTVDRVSTVDANDTTHNTSFHTHGISYSQFNKHILRWGEPTSSEGFLRTEAPVYVAGINGDSPVLNIQKQDARAYDPTYKITITESTVMCYSPATQDYQNNRSGFDLTDGEARLYIHGHMYRVGVSAKGFIYDMNNPEFVDPIASRENGDTIQTLNNVQIINWKRIIDNTTYTGILELTASGLKYNGSFKVDGDLTVVQAATIGTVMTVPTVHAESVMIKNNGAYVGGKAGVTTIYNYTNLRFDVAHGSTASSSIISLVARRHTLTYVGGILTAAVQDQTDTVLSRITTPHPVQLVNQ